MEADSILCEITCDAHWRLPEITEQAFEGGWSPALAHRGMSRQITGDYCKWDPICAHRLVRSGKTSVKHSPPIQQIAPTGLRSFLKIGMRIPLLRISSLTSDILVSKFSCFILTKISQIHFLPAFPAFFWVHEE